VGIEATTGLRGAWGQPRNVLNGQVAVREIEVSGVVAKIRTVALLRRTSLATACLNSVLCVGTKPHDLLGGTLS